MKQVILIVFILFSKTLWSQKVVLYELRVDARTNMENYIKFYATGVGGESLVFKTDYGTLSQYRDMLIYKTDKPGKVHFKVYRKQRGKLMLYDSVEVMVYENKFADARIGIKNSGSCKKDELIAYRGLIAFFWTRENHDDPVGVKSYTVIFHKNDGSVLVQKNEGNRYTESTIQVMRELQPGERITFTNIQVLNNYGAFDLHVKPVEFTIL